MAKIKRKYLIIISGISLLALIIGIIFNANTIVMSGLIGIFVSSLVQLFIHNKRTE
ncbi:hypothetical protein PGH12_06040 [Chryseobacterium wangxinyae]|uniref:hypothetical protein n=1 Tax=Chryseobacterium sp. CY350 TaxID=2997336 RepID=UPI002270AF3C|nr:hypothetical protein [Chryseobacterium sp. CY350]MCY0976708.1 hypothetical protein [Chryseobacterium sp. CY350]WBZ96709.1 hypothetical protein PGH12_06040 [Chryseobacterium sp. CY350]